MQSFEAFYRFFLSLYRKNLSNTCAEDITSLLQDLVLRFSELKTEEAMPAFRECAENTFSAHSEISFTSFTSFMEELCKKQSTIKFWYNFVIRAGATSPVGQVSTGPLFSPSALTADLGDYIRYARINRRTKYGKY